MQCLGGFSKHRDLIGWGQFCESVFSALGQDIDKRTLALCFPWVRISRKIIYFFRKWSITWPSRDKPCKCKMGFMMIYMANMGIKMTVTTSRFYFRSLPVLTSHRSRVRSFWKAIFYPFSFGFELENESFSMMTSPPIQSVLRIWSFRGTLKYHVTTSDKIRFSIFYYFSKSKSNTQSESFWKPLWSGVQWIDHDQIGLSAYGRDYVITEKIG